MKQNKKERNIKIILLRQSSGDRDKNEIPFILLVPLGTHGQGRGK
jgi:hypothetical protein